MQPLSLDNWIKKSRFTQYKDKLDQALDTQVIGVFVGEGS